MYQNTQFEVFLNHSLRDFNFHLNKLLNIGENVSNNKMSCYFKKNLKVS